MMALGAVLTVILSLALLAAPLATEAQSAAKVPRIGALLGELQGDIQVTEAFRRGLQDLGYVEGQSISIEHRFGGGRLDRFPELASELVRLKVDVILAPGTAAAQAAHKATTTIPIVIVTAGNPVGDGLINSFARPGGNVTGLTMSVDQAIGGKFLELLKEAVPTISRVAVLWNPLTAPHAVMIKEMKAVAWTLGPALQPFSARGRDEIDGAFAAISRARADGLIVLADPIFVSARVRRQTWRRRAVSRRCMDSVSTPRQAVS